MKQAFPTLEQGGNGLELTDTGMSLRDYFAAKAMQGWLASFPEHVEASTAEKSCHVTARLAYTIADAMMKARGES